LDPNEATACARQLVDKKVVAMVGGQSIVGDANIQAILQAAGIPIIGINPINGALFNAPNVYLPQVGAIIQYQAMLAYAAKHGWTPTAWAFSDTPSGRAFVGIADNAAKAVNGGTGLEPQVPVSTTASDFAPIAAAVNRGNPKSMLSLVGIRQGVPLIKAL